MPGLLGAQAPPRVLGSGYTSTITNENEAWSKALKRPGLDRETASSFCWCTITAASSSVKKPGSGKIEGGK
ncbi:hypothetical protein CCMA1212_002347 [Trichoderma ghanense]|uniref:Uncharacterized protein n=1 Tax=Trichoderma ghanense TaxID=65468 RepID=A0ABY2HEU0_9HYPO